MRWNMMSMLAGVGIGAACAGMMKNRNRGKVENMADEYLQSEMDEPRTQNQPNRP